MAQCTVAGKIVDFGGIGPLGRLRSRIGWPFVACLAIGVAIILWNPNYRWSESREVPYGADFLQEWTAGDMLWNGSGTQIYDPTAFQNWQHDASRTGFQWPSSEFYPAVYPPPHYLLVSPLAFVPYRWAVVLWLAILLGLYWGTIWLTQLPAAKLPTNFTTSTTAFWLAFFLFPAFFTGLVMGQKGTLWLFLAAASWQLWRIQRPIAAGCVWSLLSVKPTLFVWLPLLMLLHRQRRFCIGAFAGFCALWGATALIVPVEMWRDFFQVVTGAVNYQSHGGYRPGWSVSLISAFRAIGCNTTLVCFLWTVACSVIVFSIVWPLRTLTRNEQQIRSKLERPTFLLQTFLATALLSPHFYYYDLVWLALPIRSLFCEQPRRAIGYLVVVWLGMLAVESLPIHWPILSLLLLGVFIHTAIAERSDGVMEREWNGNPTGKPECTQASDTKLA